MARGCGGEIRRDRVSGASRIEWVVVAVAVAAVLLGATHAGVTEMPEFSTTTIKARPGDTLWELAAAHPVEGMTTGETAAVIAEMNGMSEDAIRIGSCMIVPATADGSLAVAMR